MALSEYGEQYYQRWLAEQQPDDPAPPPSPLPEDRPEDDPVPQFAVTRLSDVKPERVSWLWPARLPMGKLVTLDGDPGVGKSTLALTFAAIVTTGGMWPDKTLCEHPGDVILMSAEDGLADTIRPRLDAADADVTKVHAVQGVPLDSEGEALRMATLADVEMLRRLINRTRARLVIVDVLMAYVPTGIDSYKDQDVRRMLARLAALAETTGCTIVLLRHLNKGKGDPLYRGGGSIGIVGASRVGLLVAPDPNDDNVRVLASVKNNLAPTPASLTYRLVADDLYDVARIQWVGVSEHDARALLADADHMTEMGTGAEAQMWLGDYLDQQGRVRSKDAKSDGHREGFSQSSIERAASKLRVIVESAGFPRVTYWSLPKTQSRQPLGTDVTDVTDVTERDLQVYRDPADVTGDPVDATEEQSHQLHQPLGTDMTEGFTPPTGPGRCPECGFHTATQGHRTGCSANDEEGTE